ncbi:MAG TPA: nucleotidyltransferase [bacterium]|nr:nucleotidyltransferase [bacterium]
MKEFLRLLKDNDVDYLLIGGYAVGYYGYPRATVDMDIWVATDQMNASKIVQVVKEFGFDTPDLSEQLITVQKKIIRMGMPPIRIEILCNIDGVDFQECYAKKIVDSIDGETVNIIDLESLKKNKQASGRSKDLADLENLP